jgi:hypothetical protein
VSETESDRGVPRTESAGSEGARGGTGLDAEYTWFTEHALHRITDTLICSLEADVDRFSPHELECLYELFEKWYETTHALHSHGPLASATGSGFSPRASPAPDYAGSRAVFVVDSRGRGAPAAELADRLARLTSAFSADGGGCTGVFSARPLGGCVVWCTEDEDAPAEPGGEHWANLCRALSPARLSGPEGDAARVVVWVQPREAALRTDWLRASVAAARVEPRGRPPPAHVAVVEARLDEPPAQMRALAETLAELAEAGFELHSSTAMARALMASTRPRVHTVAASEPHTPPTPLSPDTPTAAVRRDFEQALSIASPTLSRENSLAASHSGSLLRAPSHRNVFSFSDARKLSRAGARLGLDAFTGVYNATGSIYSMPITVNQKMHYRGRMHRYRADLVRSRSCFFYPTSDRDDDNDAGGPSRWGAAPVAREAEAVRQVALLRPVPLRPAAQKRRRESGGAAAADTARNAQEETHEYEPDDLDLKIRELFDGNLIN